MRRHGQRHPSAVHCISTVDLHDRYSLTPNTPGGGVDAAVSQACPGTRGAGQCCAAFPGTCRARPRRRGSRTANRSCSVMTSPSMPSTSVMWVIRRVPSLQPGLVDDQVERRGDLLADRPQRQVEPAISTIVSSRDSASRGELAWTVVSEPSWPVFIACSMSSASPPRTSPTMMRSGRMRSALRTRSRMVTSPRPSMLGGPGLQAHDVVLVQLELGGVLDRDDPLVVGDERGQHVQRRRLAGAGAAGDQDVQPALHAGASNSAMAGVSVPNGSGRSTVNGSAANLRIVRSGPRATAAG